MNKAKKTVITIIGAGITGCFLSILLAKRGYTVEIYERLSQEDIISEGSKKSFNLTFYGYAVDVLEKNDLWQSIEPHVVKLEGSMTHVTPDATPIFGQFDQKKMPYYTVSRAKLLTILMQQAVIYKNISFHFETPLVSINRHDKTILVEQTKINTYTNIACDVVIGTDGVNSLVRSFLQQGQETYHTQEYADWNYKQIAISSEVAMEMELQKNIVYTWTRQDAVCVAFPNQDCSFSTMIILPNDKGFTALTSHATGKQFIIRNFPQLLPAFPAITTAIEKNPPGNFVTVHTFPWYYKDFLVLLGDSVHGFPPFFGQGMSAAFGDCLALVRLIDKYATEWGTIFPLYASARKRHMDALGKLSQEGLLRYRRYKKADYTAIYDKFESILHTFFPKYFLPPLFISIATDPDHTADHVEKHKKQRTFLNHLGGSLLVGLVTGIVNLQEKISRK